jgi:acetoin:2,6-dichlorophenolindophenol oxidoreductase subunit beta
MCSASRRLSFSLAINEALRQAMERDPSVVVIGQGVKSPWYVGNTCRGLVEAFGEDRVFDTPVSENAVTGAAVGAALSGLKPIVVHPRMDFMLYAFDPIINAAANWSYMSGGTASVPVVFWGIINRRGEQAAQHSQALHSIFAHIPGLKVVAPGTPCDAKGLMAAALEDPNPVVFVDDRELYGLEEDVPEEPFVCEIGKAAVRRVGKDVTIIAFSSMLPKALAAADALAQDGIDSEVLDLRTLKPLDDDAMFASVRKTGRVLVCDIGWRTGGIGAEIAARISEACWKELKQPVRRVALPDLPAAAARTLEKAFYPGADQIAESIRELVQRGAVKAR